MKIVFKINIFSNYNLNYCVISQENQETIPQEEVIPCITRNRNTI